MYKTISVLTALCALAAAIPKPVPVVAAPSDLDVNNPSGSDPTSLPDPTTISFPGDVAEDPFPNGLPTQPDVCDGQNPSEDCFKAMAEQGGYLWYDKDSQCSDTQKGQLKTALWDASTLAHFASNFPDDGQGTRGQAGGIYYMGPDYASQQGRIAGNLKRALQFKTTATSTSAYITTSCKDTKNQCNLKIDGKAVGGYAWTYSGWFAYYHYITLCPTFFTLESLSDKLGEIQQDISEGSSKKAGDMRYLRSTGQFLLHEMMHTRIADGGIEPHINDEYVVPIPAGEKAGTNDVKAYGPRLVHNLARRNINQGGGVTRASTNADSYAMLANCAWWWETTGYFPGVPGRPAPGTASVDDTDPELPLSLYIDFDNSTDPTTADFTALFGGDLQAFADGPPELDIPAEPTTPVATPEPTTPVSQISDSQPAPTQVPVTTTTPPAPEITCPVSNDDHWPSCDECPDSYDQNTCIASEASAACRCAAPCGGTYCILV